MNDEALHVNSKIIQGEFGEKAKVVKSIVLSMPYSKVKDEKVLKFRLDDKDYVVELGKHFVRY